LEVETVEQLFTKIRNDFGETLEEEKKIEQLQTIEQGSRTCDCPGVQKGCQEERLL